MWLDHFRLLQLGVNETSILSQIRTSRRFRVGWTRQSRGGSESSGQPRARFGFRSHFSYGTAARCPVACVHVVSSHLSQIHFNFTRRNARPFHFLLPKLPFPSSLLSLSPPRLLCVIFTDFLKRTDLSVLLSLSLSLSLCLTRGTRVNLDRKTFLFLSCLSPLTRPTIQIASSLVSSSTHVSSWATIITGPWNLDKDSIEITRNNSQPA